METFLITYGADNELATFQANSLEDAMREFYNHFEGEINTAFKCEELDIPSFDNL